MLTYELTVLGTERRVNPYTETYRSKYLDEDGGFNSSHLVYINGDCGEVVNAPDCEFGIHGFDPHQSPIFNIIGI